MKMKNLLLMLFAVSFLHTPVSATDDYQRNWNVDVMHYRFHLELRDDTNSIAGKTDITVRFVTDGISEFSLDLIGRDPGAETGMEIADVSHNGDPVHFSHVDDRITISMSSPSSAEERRIFTIAYQGIPADGLIIAENMFGDRTFFGDNWPNRARHWLPTVDHVSDKATVEWIVIAPNHYQVIGTGRLIEQTSLSNGYHRTHWGSSVPIPPKVMVIGAARFAVKYVGTVSSVPLQSWVYPQNRDEGFYDYAIAEKVLRFFDGHIGPFPYEKLANVQSKTRYGGMENASNIFYSERSVSGNRTSEGLIAHEVAHQWFGDSVTEKDWHHIWLSEGFATYFTQLYNEFTQGHDAIENGMRGARNTVIAFYAQNSELALIAEQLTDPNRMLNRNAYQKGAWLLHMLRRQIGDEAFWDGIREYYREYRDANALTEDLQRVMEKASNQNLKQFFQQWAYVPGHPILEGTWRYDANAGQLNITIEQTQSSETIFMFPLDIEISTSEEVTRVETLQMRSALETFSLSVDSAPNTVTLDPDTWLLFEGELSQQEGDVSRY